jgi:hypothetical protein
LGAATTENLFAGRLFYREQRARAYRLERDSGLDAGQLMKPDWCLHNTKHGIHGYYERSHRGAMVSQWNDGEWTINFVEVQSVER